MCMQARGAICLASCGTKSALQTLERLIRAWQPLPWHPFRQLCNWSQDFQASPCRSVLSEVGTVRLMLHDRLRLFDQIKQLCL